MDSVSGANESRQKATQEEDASLEESSLNPPELEIHKFIQCDGCSMYPIIGVRYVCSECDDFDLCSNCEKDGVHQQHILVLSTTVKSQEEDTSSVESSVNPPELEIHTCEGCSMNPIIGDRYMCCECDDLSLCTSCQEDGVHAHHLLVLSTQLQNLKKAIHKCNLAEVESIIAERPELLR